MDLAKYNKNLFLFWVGLTMILLQSYPGIVNRCMKMVSLDQRPISALEVQEKLQKFVDHDGDVKNLFIQFEDQLVPIKNENELYIISVLASIYHTNTILKNFEVSVFFCIYLLDKRLGIWHDDAKKRTSRHDLGRVGH